MATNGRHPGPAGRRFLKRLAKVPRRARRVLTDTDHRHAWEAYALTSALKRLNPNLRFLGLEDEDGITFVHLDDKVLTSAVVARGEFQRGDLITVCDLAERLAPRPTAKVFVDVGANVGTTTLYAMRTGVFERVVALEPSPDNLDVLRLNLLANGLGDQVTVIPAACGAEIGTVGLWLSSSAQSDHRVARGAAASPIHERRVDVDMVTLDEALATSGLAPEDVSIVWVDTQGHEPQVLAGAVTTIKAGVPFSIEFWPDQYLEAGTLDELLDLITSHFSHFVNIREVGLEVQPVSDLRVLSDRLLTTHDQTDVLLLPARD